MQRIFSAIATSLVKRILIFGLMCLLIVPGLLICGSQPALANPLQPQGKLDRAYTMSESTGLREEQRQDAYEEATEAVSSNPKQGIEKIYEEDLQEYREENPNKGGLIEGAKDLVEKVTGKE